MHFRAIAATYTESDAKDRATPPRWIHFANFTEPMAHAMILRECNNPRQNRQ
jgi:hypothetical protein